MFFKVGKVLPFSAMVYVSHNNTKDELARKYTLKWLVKILRYCYYVLATVYGTSCICRTVYFNSMVNCQTPSVLALSYNFNCTA